ncbi:MAG: hypothetical protein ABSD50_06260 [Smithella sp.]|jgi:predicted permease
MDKMDNAEKIIAALFFLGIILVLLQMWWAKRKGASQQELLELHFFRKISLRGYSIVIIYLLFFAYQYPLLLRITLILILCIWIELYARATNYKNAKTSKEKRELKGI